MTRTRYLARHSRALLRTATATAAVSALVCAAAPTALAVDTVQVVNPSGLGPGKPWLRLQGQGQDGNEGRTPGIQEIAPKSDPVQLNGSRHLAVTNDQQSQVAHAFNSSATPVSLQSLLDQGVSYWAYTDTRSDDTNLADFGPNLQFPSRCGETFTTLSLEPGRNADAQGSDLQPDTWQKYELTGASMMRTSQDVPGHPAGTDASLADFAAACSGAYGIIADVGRLGLNTAGLDTYVDDITANGTTWDFAEPGDGPGPTPYPTPSHTRPPHDSWSPHEGRPSHDTWPSHEGRPSHDAWPPHHTRPPHHTASPSPTTTATTAPSPAPTPTTTPKPWPTHSKHDDHSWNGGGKHDNNGNHDSWNGGGKHDNNDSHDSWNGGGKHDNNDSHDSWNGGGKHDNNGNHDSWNGGGKHDNNGNHDSWNGGGKHDNNGNHDSWNGGGKHDNNDSHDSWNGGGKHDNNGNHDSWNGGGKHDNNDSHDSWNGGGKHDNNGNHDSWNGGGKHDSWSGKGGSHGSWKGSGSHGAQPIGPVDAGEGGLSAGKTEAAPTGMLGTGLTATNLAAAAAALLAAATAAILGRFRTLRRRRA
ncbi:hypothetical protein LRD69_19040 [Streptomyces sp. JH14]|uniref:hypothetical protein n=1 Tax=Streptomyces sp. JH14 TaxID=2793630 RepID=UPI0023F725F4|nr:hypothetical protein [Streptomyces sp. JH14]MDF6044195.1 hypothetical protein [Streptomyces sp. JH14]